MDTADEDEKRLFNMSKRASVWEEVPAERPAACLRLAHKMYMKRDQAAEVSLDRWHIQELHEHHLIGNKLLVYQRDNLPELRASDEEMRDWFRALVNGSEKAWDDFISRPWFVGITARGTHLNIVANAAVNLSIVCEKLGVSDRLQCELQLVMLTGMLWFRRALHMRKLFVEVALEEGVEDVVPPPLVFLTQGHSLGGLYAQTLVTDALLGLVPMPHVPEDLNLRFACTTFESPGLPRQYMEKLRDPRWQFVTPSAVFTDYLSFPNPINTFNPHPGRIVHVLPRLDTTFSFISRCVTADACRWVGLANAAKIVCQAGPLRLPLPGLALIQCVLNTMINALAAISPTTAWLPGMASLFAAALGLEVEEVLRSHKLPLMYTALRPLRDDFDPRCTRVMKRWPLFAGDPEQLRQGRAMWLRRSLVPSHLARSNLGWWNMADRAGMVARRCEEMPGYQPLQGIR